MQVLERKIKINEVEDLYSKFQVSYNSDGHITLRMHYDDDRSKDVIVCLTAFESKKLIEFICKYITR